MIEDEYIEKIKNLEQELIVLEADRDSWKKLFEELLKQASQPQITSKDVMSWLNSECR